MNFVACIPFSFCVFGRQEIQLTTWIDLIPKIMSTFYSSICLTLFGLVADESSRLDKC